MGLVILIVFFGYFALAFSIIWATKPVWAKISLIVIFFLLIPLGDNIPKYLNASLKCNAEAGMHVYTKADGRSLVLEPLHSGYFRQIMDNLASKKLTWPVPEFEKRIKDAVFLSQVPDLLFDESFFVEFVANDIYQRDKTEKYIRVAVVQKATGQCTFYFDNQCRWKTCPKEDQCLKVEFANQPKASYRLQKGYLRDNALGDKYYANITDIRSKTVAADATSFLFYGNWVKSSISPTGPIKFSCPDNYALDLDTRLLHLFFDESN